LTYQVESAVLKLPQVCGKERRGGVSDDIFPFKLQRGHEFLFLLLNSPHLGFMLYRRPDFKMPIASPNPRRPAKTNPRIPSTGKPYIKGPLFAMIMSEEPIIKAEITRLKEIRLLDLSISAMNFERP